MMTIMYICNCNVNNESQLVLHLGFTNIERIYRNIGYSIAERLIEILVIREDFLAISERPCFHFQL